MCCYAVAKVPVSLNADISRAAKSAYRYWKTEESVPDWDPRNDTYRSFRDKVQDWSDFDMGLKAALEVSRDLENGGLIVDGKGSGKGQKVMNADGRMVDRGDPNRKVAAPAKKNDDDWWNSGDDPWKGQGWGSGWSQSSGWRS